MGWRLLAVALVAVATTATVLVATLRRRRRAGARPAHRPGATVGRGDAGGRAGLGRPLMGPEDAAELDAMFAAASIDDRRHRDEVLVAHLLPLVRRQVPVRRIEPLAHLGVTRIRFADGTAIVARGTTAGDLGVLATVVRDRSVGASSCVPGPTGPHLVFTWDGRPRGLTVVVSGLDQPQ